MTGEAVPHDPFLLAFLDSRVADKGERRPQRVFYSGRRTKEFEGLMASHEESTSDHIMRFPVHKKSISNSQHHEGRWKTV